MNRTYSVLFSVEERAMRGIVRSFFCAGLLSCFLLQVEADEFEDAHALHKSGQYGACIRAAATGIDDTPWDESWRDLKIRAEFDTGPESFALDLRLRYEIRREIAPYVGVSWQDRKGEKDFVSLVAGARFWF